MLFITGLAALAAALISPLATAAPAPWGGGGGLDTFEDFCGEPASLVCCNGIGGGDVAGLPTGTATGCINARDGGRITYEYGFCPEIYDPLCCEVFVLNGLSTGCTHATQVDEPSS